MVYVKNYKEYVVYIWVIYHLPGGWCWDNGHGPIPPAPPAITSPGLAMTLTIFTVLALHRADLDMCLCAFALLLKNDGTCRDSQELQTYRVTVVRLPPSDIAQAQNSITAEYKAMNMHWLRIPNVDIWNIPVLYQVYNVIYQSRDIQGISLIYIARRLPWQRSWHVWCEAGVGKVRASKGKGKENERNHKRELAEIKAKNKAARAQIVQARNDLPVFIVNEPAENHINIFLTWCGQPELPPPRIWSPWRQHVLALLLQSSLQRCCVW